MNTFAESTKIYDVIEKVNKKALSEKQGGGRPPFWEMVFWWTRKPLVGARAAIIASLLPETVSPREFLRMIGNVKKDELDGTAHRVNPKIPEKYEVYFKGKKLLDPFAGFGSIPLEAVRLRMSVVAGELLPTAYVFLKAVLEYPTKYGKQLAEDVKRWGEWVTKTLKGDEEIRELYNEDTAVYIGSWEVRCPHCGRWTPIIGNWWLARVRDNKGNYRRLAYFEPVKDEGGIGIRIVDVNRDVEDATSDKRVAMGKIAKARVDARSGKIEIEGFKEYKVPEANIYARGGRAWCLNCGMEIRYVDENGVHYSTKNGNKGLTWYIKWALKKYHEGDENYARQRLLVKVKIINGDLIFEPCSDDDNTKLERAREKVRELLEEGDPDVPTEPVAPWGSKGMGGDIKTITWGLDTWNKHFNPRQLLTLIKLVKLIREAGKRIEEEKIKEGWSEKKAFDYAEAIATYLSIALCKMVNYYSIATRWHPVMSMIGETLSTRGIAMMWNWTDANPFAEITGTLVRSLRNSHGGLKYLISAIFPSSQLTEIEENSAKIKVIQDDATTLIKLDDEKFDIIVTDPPYADDVPYTELSDFYYVWLKRALSDSDGRRLTPRFHSEAFFKKVGAKYKEIQTQWQEFAKREISTNPGRFIDDKLNEDESRIEVARKHFEELFTQAFIAMKDKLAENGIIAAYYAHTSFEAWANLIEAIKKAGLKITGAFPAATESKDRVTARGKMTMDTSIVVICRKADERKDMQINTLLPLIEREMRAYAEKLAMKDIYGRDVLIGTMVGALKVITSYNRILSPAGEVRVEELLENYVYPLAGKVLAEVYGGSAGVRDPITDPYALFYLLAKVIFSGRIGTNPFTSDDVINLCRATKLDRSSAELLLSKSRIGKKESEEESEEEEVSKSTVRLLEIKSKEPKKIKNLLINKGVDPDSIIPKIKTSIDAFHLLCYYAASFHAERIKAEVDELKSRYPREVEEALKLARIFARMESAGVEGELSKKLIGVFEGLTF